MPNNGDSVTKKHSQSERVANGGREGGTDLDDARAAEGTLVAQAASHGPADG